MLFDVINNPYELWTKKKPNLNYLRVWGCRAVVRLCDPKLNTLGERGIECIFVGYAEYSKAFRFYVIEPNDSDSINLIIESRDAIFDENRFSSVPRLSLRIPNGTEDIGGSVVTEEEQGMRSNKDEIVSIMPNNTWVLADLPLGIDYFDTYAPVARISTIRLLIAIASIHNLIIHQMDVKTAFLNGDLEEEVYMNQPQGFIMPADKCVYSKFDESGKGVIICLYVDDMLIFGTDQVQVDLTKEFLSSRFSMKDMGKADVILVSTLMNTSEKLMLNNGHAVSQLEYSRMIGCLIYTMTCTRPDIAFAASKKQTYITGSTMESKFVALAAAGKEAEWLRNLLLEIPLWFKPITPISIGCDSAVTLAKAYSQMYNGKSRHLGVRHSMIRELITNGVVSIEFVRYQQNLVDHLTKGLARDLVIKSAEGMGLKSN
ncbi:zinc finger, CCHC-type containing protein [Tanacetum coccineum]